MIEYGVEEVRLDRVDINQSYKSSAREWYNGHSYRASPKTSIAALKTSWAPGT